MNALKWLVAKQGYKNGDRAIVAWATNNTPVPPPLDDFFSTNWYSDSIKADTNAEFAARLNKALAGYSTNLDDATNVVVMGLDSATLGRLSITYYRELSGSEFLNRLRKWQISANWYPLFRSEKTDEKKSKIVKFRGNPLPKYIAEAAYGRELNDKLKKLPLSAYFPA